MNLRRLLVVSALALLVVGCLGPDDSPTPSPTAGVTLPPSTEAPRTPGEMVVAVPADPTTFLLPADDETGALLIDLLYDPLYRLDPTLTAQPALASALPEVSDDGLTWQVALLSGSRFHDDTLVEPEDVRFTLELAASARCPFGRSMCDAVATHMASVEASGSAIIITLRDAWAPFLSVVLGRLPILSDSAVRSATDEVVRSSADLDPVEIAARISHIADETNAERCLVALPPTGCRLGDYTVELAGLLRHAGLQPPPEARFTTAEGELDAEAEGAALLQAVGSLAGALGVGGIDQFAAVVPLLDVTRDRLGSGPFRLESYEPGVAIRLARNGGHQPRATLEAIRLRVMRDPAVAATALRSRTVDWMLQVVPDQAAALATDPSLRVSAHPDPAVRTIIFNVRPGRVFADAVARRAFALCLDRDGLVRDATAGAALSAHVETGPRSWAVAGAAPPPAPDPGGAATMLETAGWTRDDDGIFSRDGERLSGLIYVRPSRVDLLAFARAASEALRVCGIDLQVVEQDQPGDLLLGQLQWPNDFETVLVTRPVGVDPDIDFQAFAGDHVTSAKNPADANPGGYTSVTLDGLLAEARTSTDSNGRAALYAQVADRLAQDVPSYPIWYDASFAAINSTVRAEGAGVDLQRPRYWWNAWSWDVAP